MAVDAAQVQAEVENCDVSAGQGDAPCCPPCEQPATQPATQGGGLRRRIRGFASALLPPLKSAEDYGGTGKTICNLSYEELHKTYPSLCFCSPEKGETCLLAPEGHKGQLPFKAKLLWACPMFGWYAMRYLMVGYMKKFYMDDYPKASLGVIAFSSVLAVLVDAFTDPKMATWTDQLRSKYGRRRPFIFFSAFFAPCAFVLAWLPSVVGPGTPASIWYGVFAICLALADTVFAMPHEAWGAQMTPIYKERTRLWLLSDVLANIGILFGMAIVPLLFVTTQCSSTPDNGCWELPIISAIFGGIFSTCCLLLCYFGKEPDVKDTLANEGPAERKMVFKPQDTVPMLVSTFLNKPFRMLLVADIAKAVGQEIPFNVLSFMTAWVLGEKCFVANDFFGYLVVGNLICAIISLMPWTWLAALTSKYRAYFVYNIAVAVTSLSFIFLGFDNGDCQMSYLTLGLTCLFGAAYGGSFLLKDLISDIVDYDEFLTGGLRREASYMMVVDFIPKFMKIPGECVPFMVLAYFNYTRPIPTVHRQPCSRDMIGADAFCASYYMTEPVGANWCSTTATCQQWMDDGVNFVCNYALNECGHMQNERVRMALLLCFSVVPCLWVLAGLFSLYFYPKCARTEEMHEELIKAMSELKNGKTVEDPWRPGSFVQPRTDPTPNSGALSYFTPSELLQVIQDTPRDLPAEEQVANIRKLWRNPLAYMLGFATLLPLGGYFVSIGIEDLSTDLGASVSPLGLMVVGISMVGMWFHGARLMATSELQKQKATLAEVIAMFNSFTPFTGQARVPLSN